MITVITISCYTPNLFILPTTNSTPGPWRSQVSKCDIQHAHWGPQTHDSSTVSHCSDSGVPWVSYIGYLWIIIILSWVQPSSKRLRTSSMCKSTSTPEIFFPLTLALRAWHEMWHGEKTLQPKRLKRVQHDLVSKSIAASTDRWW